MTACPETRDSAEASLEGFLVLHLAVLTQSGMQHGSSYKTNDLTRIMMLKARCGRQYWSRSVGIAHLRVYHGAAVNIEDESMHARTFLLHKQHATYFILLP